MKLKKEVLKLKELDPVLGKVIDKNLDTLKDRGTVYENLLSAIISQQISTSAAVSIKAKFLKAFNGKFPQPKTLLNAKEEKLRGAGLSGQKLSYMKNVAKHFLDEKLDENKFHKMLDREIIDDLVKIKGVGEWTAEMILIFTLKRPDVFSYKDLALVSAVHHLYKINPKKHTPKKLKEKVLKITDSWTPYRSLASRYLWEFNDEMKRQKKLKK